jgi:hypothetical protein
MANRSILNIKNLRDSYGRILKFITKNLRNVDGPLTVNGTFTATGGITDIDATNLTGLDVNATADVTIDSEASVLITSTEDVVNAISLTSNSIYFNGGDQNDSYLFYHKPLYLDIVTAPDTVTGKLWCESGYLLTWGGLGFQTIGSGHFNTTGADYDFRVQSNNQTHAFFVDGGNDEIQINSRTATATGGGFDGAAGVTQYVSKVNGEIITTILVDIEDLYVGTAVNDIIGEEGVAAAYITQITTAVNGIVYKADMSCIELPAGTNTTADIDLAANSNSLAEDVAVNSTGTLTSIISAGGVPWTAGMSRTSTLATDFTNLVNDYLYLSAGSSAQSGGQYTAGKFIIKLYGASF